MNYGDTVVFNTLLGVMDNDGHLTDKNVEPGHKGMYLYSLPEGWHMIETPLGLVPAREGMFEAES